MAQSGGPPHVVVVGAGAAGLAAASHLCRRGVAVTVLEARARIGGRIDTRKDAVLGIALEGGAEFVHGRPERTLALARRARAAVRQVPDRHLRRRGARLVDGASAFSRVQELLALGTRDDEPFAAVLRRARAGRPFGDAATMAREFVRGFYLADPGTASSLALARMTRALEEIGGDAIHRVEGGYARVLAPLVRVVALAELRLSTIVEEIHWARGRVEVRARGAAGSRLSPVRGARAVITVPLPMLRDGALRFVPALPEKQRAAAALEMGPIVKVLLRFRRAQWPDSGPDRLVFMHVAGAAVPVFWTLAPLDAPVLVGWAGGSHAERLAGMPERQVVRAALRSVARGLGRTETALEEQLDAAIVVDWTRDPFAGGGYAVFPVRSSGASEALARSVEDTLFFAGEATAGADAGTVEGALQSGERAAREVIATL